MISLQDFIVDRTKLPTPSVIALKILESIRDEEKSFSDLEKIIMADPALTARILKIANSAFYGLSHPVDSLQRATTLIGTKNLENIALSFVIVKNFRDAPQGSFDIDLFWRRSISNAVAAEILSEKLGHNNSDMFISGLLQDIGVLVMFLSDPASYSQMLDDKRIKGMSVCAAEKGKFEFDHTEVGSFILKSWNLPEKVWLPIRYHHMTDSQNTSVSAQMLYMADKISAMYHGTQVAQKSVEVRHFLMENYQIDGKQADSLIDAVGDKAREIIKLFDVDPGEMKPFSQIMQEANDELARLNLSYGQIVLELKNAKQNAEQLAIELKRANDNLRELAYRDELTGLYNHRYFREVLDAEIERSHRYKRQLSLLLLDLDHFKNVNDTQGHLAGDHVLKEVSRLMSGLVRRSDILARYGGEEFAILLPETAESGAKVFAQRVRRGIEQHHFSYNNQEIQVTVSIGSASMCDDQSNVTATDLISSSDQALYEAKRKGRNRIAINSNPC